MTNGHFQEETNRNDHITPMYDVTPRFKKLRNLRSYMSQSVRAILSRMSFDKHKACLLYTSPSPRDQRGSRMPSSA